MPPPPPGLPSPSSRCSTATPSWCRSTGVEEEVRLLGINAPEQDECFGAQAREAAATLLAAGPLRLDIEAERDQFGRLLAYVHAGETLLNLALVEDGFALALQDDHPRLAEFLQADERAFAAGLGLWAADACGAPSSAPVTLLDVELDPAGRDEDDLNGEWVLLGNLADQDADLTGWALRDESSEHRYRFPAGTLLRPGEQVAVHTGEGDDAPGDLYWAQRRPGVEQRRRHRPPPGPGGQRRRAPPLLRR